MIVSATSTVLRQITRRLSALVAGVLLLTLGLVASGCDSMLDIEPQGEQTSANFFRTPEDANRALAGVYSAIQQQKRLTYQGAPEFLAGYDMVFGSVASDDSFKGGESRNDQPDIDDIQTFTVDPNNLYIAKMWSSLYEAVTRSNRLLDRVPDIEMDPEEKADILAEARFLRAYAYFYLLQAFGTEPETNNGPGIVLVNDVVTIGGADKPRSPEPEVWTQIETDLQAAINELPTKSERGAEQYGRATTGAAKALLVKAHIFQEDWPAAEPLALEVISSSEYRLEPDFSSIFRLSGEHGPGSIFEINYATLPNQVEGYYGNVYQASRSTWGFGFNNPTEDLYQAFDSNDPRRDATIIEPGEQMPDGTVVAGGSSRSGYHNEKIWIPQSEYPQAQGIGVFAGPSNVRYIRLANVLLWHAEAAAENGNLPAARESLNRVRARARDDDDNPNNDPAGVLPDITTTDAQELLEAIYRERRLELAMEDLRFFDLVRQGRAPEVLGDAGFDAGTHERMPIPQREIDLSDGVLTQNPGY
ncbi:RagB/SusD family nutrient uptake outer membrane protein [Longibacter salinarum]|uniref:RagB/SusD family nutrient uptake outer membrane protein n=1 Tax=Longibacter salinarum TaxID=1850348 RepID=A0A2A8CW00_9BACT|nr:RagB/SusD family nutrient uptake outer membrane protein [Longibacter salinarum]PEN12767.1 RagB/SusD family nutrient uptake outer membrane protein [Longibacter salinarum]